MPNESVIFFVNFSQKEGRKVEFSEVPNRGGSEMQTCWETRELVTSPLENCSFRVFWENERTVDPDSLELVVPVSVLTEPHAGGILGVTEEPPELVSTATDRAGELPRRDVVSELPEEGMCCPDVLGVEVPWYQTMGDLVVHVLVEVGDVLGHVYSTRQLRSVDFPLSRIVW